MSDRLREWDRRQHVNAIARRLKAATSSLDAPPATLRLVCGTCRQVAFAPAIAVGAGLVEPECCGAAMLWAGTPKVDAHGITRTPGGMVDPAKG